MDAKSSIKHTPLCVDLDGSLIASDTLWEGLVALLMQKPLMIFQIMGWLLAGKAVLKKNVAEYTDRSGEDWPVREEVVAYIALAKSEGRKVYLVTGAAQKTAKAISDHLGLFDGIYHSDDTVNLTSTRKRDKLIEEFGDGGFDYIGNSSDDIAVFENARKGIVVAPDRSAKSWQKKTQSEEIYTKPSGVKTIFKTIRAHQWLKNVLIAVPLFLNHTFLDVESITAAVIAFFSFSFFASSVYIVNDLSDLKADRAHPKKRNRPLASGAISIPNAAILWVVLLSASALLASLLPIEFLYVMVIYAMITTAYTFVLKRKLLVDVFTLASLYTVRIIAGAVATHSGLSFWLLAFSIFFFLSLALVKRYVELSEGEKEDGSKLLGRGYYGMDTAMLAQGGVSSAFTSAMVLALYINSPEFSEMYDNPWVLWPLVPLILYMLLRIWILAGRGQVHEDPVVFIMRDWRSQLTMIAGGLLIFGAML
ncbi:MAG: UbiA family prenyltransferase [Lentilitoribacter sp.]